jgi:death on curing protein
MNEPEWVLKETVIGLHEMSLNDHGGSFRHEG